MIIMNIYHEYLSIYLYLSTYIYIYVIIIILEETK